MKQAIIVGASSGLGWELAIQLADKGYQLGLMARREDLLEDLSAQLPGTPLYASSLMSLRPSWHSSNLKDLN